MEKTKKGTLPFSTDQNKPSRRVRKSEFMLFYEKYILFRMELLVSAGSEVCRNALRSGDNTDNGTHCEQGAE